VLVLPDVRGLNGFYEELALRFGEAGVHALAIDYFGRTAGTDPRADDFDYMPHVERTTWAGMQADIQAASDHLRARGATWLDTQMMTPLFASFGTREVPRTTFMRMLGEALQQPVRLFD